MRTGFVAIFLVASACSQSARESTNDRENAPKAPIASSSGALVPTAPQPGRVSNFTRLDDKVCKTTNYDRETGDWSGACPGVGGYTLEWSIGDLRDDLEIIRGKHRTQIGIPQIVSNGAFDSIGTTLEWRGPVDRQPDVLLARVHVARSDGTSDSGRLAIVRLGEKPCIVAVVPPQSSQSDKARAIADGKLATCLAP
jgi:hypothetical protein